VATAKPKPRHPQPSSRPRSPTGNGSGGLPPSVLEFLDELRDVPWPILAERREDEDGRTVAVGLTDEQLYRLDFDGSLGIPMDLRRSPDWWEGVEHFPMTSDNAAEVEPYRAKVKRARALIESYVDARG
jgi:hypothetical protein